MSLSFLRRFTISTRIALLTSVLLIAAIAVVATTSVNIAKRGLHYISEQELLITADAVASMARVQCELAEAKLNSDLAFANERLAGIAGGEAKVTESLQVDRDTTQRIGQHEVPVLRLGRYELTGDDAFVDSVLERTGSTSTVFHVLPNRWVRVATNVKKADGSRAVGTTIESDSAVYRHVMSGQTYMGVSEILGKPYNTAYQPLRDASGKIVSVLYVGVPHESFQELHAAIAGIKLGETGYVYAVDSSGRFTVHPTARGEDASQHDFIQTMIEQKEGFLEYDWEGREKYVGFTYFEPYDWYIGASSYASEFNKAATDMRTGAILIGVIVIAVGAGLAWAMGRSIGGGVRRIANAVTEISEGDGDLTRRLPEEGRDEIAHLSRGFNRFVDKIHDIIAEVRNSAREVASASTQIAASSEEMSTGMDEQTEQVRQIASAIEEMSASIGEVAGKSREAADKAEDSGRTATEGGKVVDEAVTGMSTIEQSVAASSEAVQQLGKRGEQIGEVIEVINDIADQTNLLALNAAIEAARAGEHGRGFAVVADEVRKLADRTTKATEEVAESIGAIQRETEQAVARMETGTQEVLQGTELVGRTGEALRTIVSGTGEVSEVIQAIAAAAEQQSAASEEVSRNVESIQAVTEQARESATQSATASAELSNKAESLQQLIGAFKLKYEA
ncbi:MAG: methyl-accepting chemotaxis protein [Phycisphaeraceae bacterium]